MGARLIVGRKRWHAGLAFAAAFVCAKPVLADALTLTAILSDLQPATEDAAAEAGAINLLTRSMLREHQRRFVARQDLSETLSDGKARRAFLAVTPAEAATVMKKMLADRLLRGRLEKRPDRLVVEAAVVGPDGTSMRAIVASAPRGHVFELARQIAREAAPALDATYEDVPQRSLHQLAAVVDARKRLALGQPAEAAQAFAAASHRFVASLAAVQELAQLVWRSVDATGKQRMLAAVAAGDATALRTFADKVLKADPRDAEARAARARALIRQGDLPAADRELRLLRKQDAGPATAVAFAEYALAAQLDPRERDAAFATLLSGTAKAWLEPLAFVASTEPKSFGPDIEAEFVDRAALLQADAPYLASAIGLRALRADVSPDKATRLISADHVGTGDVAAVREKVNALAGMGIGVAAALAQTFDQRDEVAKAIRQGEAAGAPGDASVTVVTALAPLLERFDKLNARGFRSASLLAVAGSGQPIYAPYAVDERALAAALAAALANPPYSLAVNAPAHPPLADDAPAPDASRSLARNLGTEALLLYRVRAEGRQAHVWLTLIDAVTGQSWRADGVLNAGAGVVRIHLTPLLVVIAVLTLVAGLIVRRRLTGTVVVQLRDDPGAEELLLCLRISKDATPPSVSNPVRFAAQMAQKSPSQHRYEATHFTSRTLFARIPRGTWYVHLYGTFKRGGDLQVAAGESFSRSIVVASGRSTQVAFALHAALARFTITVYDHDKPVAGAKVWLNEGGDAGKTTADDGCAELDVPRGRHVVHVESNGQHVSRPYDVQHIKLHELRINLDWERRRDGASRVFAGEASAPGLADVLPLPVAGSARAGSPAPLVSPPVPALPMHRRAAAYAAPAAAVAFDPDPLPDQLRPQITLGDMLAGIDDLPLAPAPLASVVAGRYEKLSQLGAGAMGIVYKARDTVLDREVALKIMSPDIRDNPMVAEKFIQEAKSLARLNHPNIVTVYDQGKDERGELYMVMELVEGGALDDLLTKRTKLPLTMALDLVDQLAAGMAYAHSRRIIHRDIKPANMFVTHDGLLKIGDFGLARAVAAAKITKTRIQGTPLYMSPEQILGRDVDFRADLYSIGCTFFELLVGQPPFIEGEVLYHHMHTAPPPPSSFDPSLPPAVDALVLRCLAKDKDERIESAEALRQGLKTIRASIP